ncbi:hypothetical protein [Gordonia hydrophobica]|uniref:Secreted protein n=1 Tax=Gordonia hydrophobica TaxID=40516 RepID=A0ABZ2TYD0_9ACTN|nr:hypothetical protein [Gordonia hydrophobica]MBM7366955.1 hypothetical protein [Gordonia hydrophobica]
MNTRALRLFPAAAILGAAVLGGAAVPAHAATPAALTIAGDLEIAPGVHLLNIDAHGVTSRSGTTTGTYTATLMNGMSKVPFQVTGPVTCIDTRGDSAALVYPISKTAPNLVPAGLADAFAVKISVRKGDTDRVGVMGPAPTSSFHGCAPAATPFRFDGDIMIE